MVPAGHLAEVAAVGVDHVDVGAAAGRQQVAVAGEDDQSARRPRTTGAPSSGSLVSWCGFWLTPRAVGEEPAAVGAAFAEARPRVDDRARGAGEGRLRRRGGAGGGERRPGRVVTRIAEKAGGERGAVHADHRRSGPGRCKETGLARRGPGGIRGEWHSLRACNCAFTAISKFGEEILCNPCKPAFCGLCGCFEPSPGQALSTHTHRTLIAERVDSPRRTRRLRSQPREPQGIAAGKLINTLVVEDSADRRRSCRPRRCAAAGLDPSHLQVATPEQLRRALRGRPGTWSSPTPRRRSSAPRRRSSWSGNSTPTCPSSSSRALSARASRGRAPEVERELREAAERRSARQEAAARKEAEQAVRNLAAIVESSTDAMSR